MIGLHFFSPYRNKKTFNNLEGNNMAAPNTKGFYSKEFKLNAVKLYVNRKKGQTLTSIAKELKIATVTFSNWVLIYREKGEEGLEEYAPLHALYEPVKLKTIKAELEAMSQAYNGIKNELSAVIKERDSLLSFKRERDKLKTLAEAILKTIES